MLVGCVLLLVMSYGETEIFGCFVFVGLMSGAGWECQSGCRGVRDKLGLEGILELAGVECGSCDKSVDLSYFFLFIIELLVGTYFLLLQKSKECWACLVLVWRQVLVHAKVVMQQRSVSSVSPHGPGGQYWLCISFCKEWRCPYSSPNNSW